MVAGSEYKPECEELVQIFLYHDSFLTLPHWRVCWCLRNETLCSSLKTFLDLFIHWNILNCFFMQSKVDKTSSFCYLNIWKWKCRSEHFHFKQSTNFCFIRSNLGWIYVKGQLHFIPAFPKHHWNGYQTSVENSCRAWRTQIEVAALLLPKQLFVLGCFDLW